MKSINAILREYLKQKGIKQTWLAGQLNMTAQGLNNFLARNDASFEVVHRISLVLQHDFFDDYSKVNLASVRLKNMDIDEATTHKIILKEIDELTENLKHFVAEGGVRYNKKKH